MSQSRDSIFNELGNVSVYIELTESTTTGPHTHATYLGLNEVMGLMDGSIPMVVKTSTEVNGHTHDVNVTYEDGAFVSCFASRNLLICSSLNLF